MSSRKIIGIVITIIVVVAAAAAALMAIFQAQPAGPEVIKIGALEPLSGPFVAWGSKHLKGMEFAVKELNERGGVLGKRVELVIADSKSDPKEAVTIYRRFVEQDKVLAVAGPVSSGVGVAVSKEAEKAGVPLFLHMAGSHRILTRGSRFTFRTCLVAAPMLAEAIANLIKDKGYKRVGAVVAEYEWGFSLRDAMDKLIKPLPGVQLEQVSAPVRERDFTTYLRKLQMLNPEIIIGTSHPPGSFTLLKQALELGLRPEVFIGAGSPPEAVVKGLGEDVFKGFTDFSCANYESSDYQRLAERFFQEFGEFFDAHALTGYVTTLLIADAIEKSNSFDPKVIADTIRAGRFVHGAYAYPLSYTDWGELKEATPRFYTYKPGSMGKVNPAANWRLEFLFKSPPLTPYVPEG